MNQSAGRQMIPNIKKVN